MQPGRSLPYSQIPTLVRSLGQINPVYASSILFVQDPFLLSYDLLGTGKKFRSIFYASYFPSILLANIALD